MEEKGTEYISYADRIIVLSNDFRDTLLKQYPGLAAEISLYLPNVPDLSQPEYKNKVVASNPFKQEFPDNFLLRCDC